MVHRVHARGFDQVDALLYGLASEQWLVDPGAKVLDFGCGEGRAVYQFRDRGFDACGFDLVDTVTLRDPSDRRLFSYLVEPRYNPADTRIKDDEIKLPYADASFDLVYSLAVIEHCYALDGMMRECARVLKPGGVSVHLYPSRNQLIEPHFHVPFGGLMQFKAWLYLWARLGLRSSGQEQMSAWDAAKHNWLYLNTGIAYRPNREVAEIAGRHFNEVSFIDRSYYPRWPLPVRARELIKAMRNGDGMLAGLAEWIKCRVLLTCNPKR